MPSILRGLILTAVLVPQLSLTAPIYPRTLFSQFASIDQPLSSGGPIQQSPNRVTRPAISASGSSIANAGKSGHIELGGGDDDSAKKVSLPTVAQNASIRVRLGRRDVRYGRRANLDLYTRDAETRNRPNNRPGLGFDNVQLAFSDARNPNSGFNSNNALAPAGKGGEIDLGDAEPGDALRSARKRVNLSSSPAFIQARAPGKPPKKAPALFSTSAYSVAPAFHTVDENGNLIGGDGSTGTEEVQPLQSDVPLPRRRDAPVENEVRDMSEFSKRGRRLRLHSNPGAILSAAGDGEGNSGAASATGGSGVTDSTVDGSTVSSSSTATSDPTGESVASGGVNDDGQTVDNGSLAAGDTPVVEGFDQPIY